MNIGTIGHFSPRISVIAISVKMVLGTVKDVGVWDSEFTGP